MAPGKARIVSRGFKNAIHVVTVDGVPEKASLNAEVMAGQRVLGLKCPDINGGATGTATLTVKAGRVYMLKPHDGKTCKLELEQYAIVRGRDADPQIRINDLPREPGREVEVNGVFEARLRPGQYTLSVTCLDVRRDAVREAPAMVEIDAKTRYFYELDASFRDTVCDAHVVTSEPL